VITQVYVAAGSNVQPEQNLARACHEVQATWPNVRFSRAYANQAVGFDGPEFINMVLAFTTDQSIEAVISRLRAVETLCGRPPNAPKWASRAMDLDILLFGSRVEKTADYTLPRPDLMKRPYMLGPMAELAPQVLHPTAGRTMGELWQQFDRQAHEMRPVSLDLPPEIN
jgi:2-amino-4-hydroxy-6-hydroxymethyldihydropteridine diphosphokinase